MAIISTLADKVNWLFQNIKNNENNEYTYKEVADGVSKFLPEGKGVGHTWVWKLRKGKLQEPSYLKLKALANFFRVPVTFFYEENLNREDLNEIKQKTNTEKEITIIARHARQMDSTGRQTLLQIIIALEKN